MPISITLYCLYWLCLLPGPLSCFLCVFAAVAMPSPQKAVSDDLVSHFISASTKLRHNKAFAKVDCCLKRTRAAELPSGGTKTLRSNPFIRLNTDAFISCFYFKEWVSRSESFSTWVVSFCITMSFARLENQPQLNNRYIIITDPL